MVGLPGAGMALLRCRNFAPRSCKSIPQDFDLSQGQLLRGRTIRLQVTPDNKKGGEGGGDAESLRF